MNTKVKQREINTLPFTDLLIKLSEPQVPSRFRPDPTKSKLSGNLAVPSDYDEDIREIRENLQARYHENGKQKGTLQYKGFRLRYSIFAAAEDEVWAAIRAVSLDLPELDSLRMHPDMVNHIKAWGRKKGLIIVGGKTGDGKTTTCVASVKHYLESIGGFLETIEDPVEYQLQGAISQKGFCLQNEIEEDFEWNDKIKDAMRHRPDYIFVGEVRTTEAAENLLKAVTSGHLVITTIHAGNTSDTVSALLHLAENKLGPVARQIIADRLVGIIHQTLTLNGPIVRAVIPSPDSNGNDEVAKIIKKGDIAALKNHTKQFNPTG